MRRPGCVSLPVVAVSTVLFTSVVLNVGPRTARGEPETNAQHPSAVSIVLAGGDANAHTALSTTLRRSLEDLGLEVNFTEVAAMNPREVAEPHRSASPRLRVWIDLGAPNVAFLYITDGNHVFTRRFVLSRSFDSVTLDLLDFVVTGSLEAVLAGRPVGIPREEFTKSLPPPPPPPDLPLPPPDPTKIATPALRSPTEASPITVSVTGFYEGALVAPRQALHGPGLMVTAARSTLRVGLSLHAHAPYDITGGGATVRLASQGIRLSAGRAFAIRPTVAVVAAMAVGVDVSYVRTPSAEGDLIPVAAFWSADPVIRSALGLESRFGRFTIGVISAIDFDLVGPRYVIAATPDSETVWVPWRWRPSIALSVGMSL